MSVSISVRKSLGSNLGPQETIHQIAAAINQMDWDAKEMGVKVDWSTVWLTLGEEYEEEMSYRGTTRFPYLQASVQGVRTGK